MSPSFCSAASDELQGQHQLDRENAQAAALYLNTIGSEPFRRILKQLQRLPDSMATQNAQMAALYVITFGSGLYAASSNELPGHAIAHWLESCCRVTSNKLLSKELAQPTAQMT